MYQSRADKIVKLAIAKLENSDKKQEEKEYTILTPLDPVPSTSSCNQSNYDVVDDVTFTMSETVCTATSKLIDECLAQEERLLTVDNIYLDPTTIPDERLDGSNQDVTNFQNDFVCFYCSLVFSNKKAIRNHIYKTHMEVEISSDDKVQENADAQSSPPKKKKKNENRATTVEKRRERKKLRISGKAYRSIKGNTVGERKRKEHTCACQFKCSNNFSDTEKDNYFFSFWKIGAEDNSQERQRQYLVNHIQEVEPKRRYVIGHQSRKKRTLEYYLEKGNARVRVCRLFFLSVFDITEKFLRVCLEKKNDTGIVSPDKRGRAQCPRKIPEWIEKHARDHIQSIPKVESHYCRKSSKKLYLSSQLNLEKLYSLYVEKCNEDNLKITEDNDKLPIDDRKPLVTSISKSVYKGLFYSYGNLSFHKPKKDLCNTCTRYGELNEVEKMEEKSSYDLHLYNKNRAREIKNEEMKKCQGTEVGLKKAVINFDLQAVLECPKGQVSSIFYKRKLAVYNLTVFDITSKEGTCCMWDETEGNRGSTEIASCIFNYIKTHNNTEEFFMMSDSCGGQNLNQFMSSALLHAVKMTNCKLIQHVYYEPGHSQMEGDSMHSAIEKAAKNIQVNVPSEWQLICKMARKTPKPYNVVLMTHDSFIDWSSLAKENKGTPRYKTVTGETVEWRKIKWFKYQKDKPDSIFFKYRYDDQTFKEIKVMKNVGRPRLKTEDLPKAYSSKLPITWPKYKDLMDLCATRVIPISHHKFYEELPHQQKPTGKTAIVPNNVARQKKQKNVTKKSKPEGEKSRNKVIPAKSKVKKAALQMIPDNTKKQTKRKIGITKKTLE